MSGTASRFQTRFGYAPGMAAGNYPLALPSLLPSVQGPPTAQPAAPAQQSTPVSAGSVPAAQAQSYAQTPGGDGGGSYGMPDASNVNGAAMAGFGTPSYGALGGLVGTLGGLAFGAPGLGLAGTALGTYADVRGYNDQLSAMGLAPSVSFGPAFGSAATFGLAGQSAANQMNAAVTPSINAATLADMNGFAADQGGLSPAGMAAVGNINDAISAGYGPESAGYGSPGTNNAPGNNASTGDNSAPGNNDTGDTGGGYGAPDSSAGGGYGGDGQWRRGGYTGQGHPAEPAGTVHRGEVVIPADMVARYGLGPLMSLVQGEVQPSRLAQLTRAPNVTEREFFATERGRGTPGYAADDGRIVMNPNPPPGVNVDAVQRNEALRLAMRGGAYPRPDFALSPEQAGMFAGYSPNVQDQRETIAARILTGDPSVGTATPAQVGYTQQLAGGMLRDSWLANLARR